MLTVAQAAPPSPVNFTVAAGQTATLRVNLFCLDFNKDFPTGQNLTVGPAADAKLISVLSYGVDKGYDKSDPRQLQLALWYLRDGTFHTNQGESKDKAQEVVDYATKNATTTTAAATTATGTTAAATTSSTSGGATALADAVKSGQVTLATTGVQPLSQGEFFGTAVVAVKNNGTSSLNLTLAPGATFTAAGANFQTTLGYVTGVDQGAQPATTTAATTTVATTTAAATTTVATTAAGGQGGAAPATTTATVSGAPATGGGATASDSDNILPLLLLSLGFVALATGGLLIVREAKHAKR